MGILRRVVTAGRRVAGYVLGPRREMASAVTDRQARVAAEQERGDAAAPWWFAALRKLWAFILTAGLMYLDHRNGWQLAGSEAEAKVGEAVWLVIGGWLTWRVSNRAA